MLYLRILQVEPDFEFLTIQTLTAQLSTPEKEPQQFSKSICPLKNQICNGIYYF